LDWKSEYKNKLCSADDAVKLIKPGNRVAIGHACGEPSALTDAMVRQAVHFRDVELFHMVCMGKAEYCKPEYSENFHYNGCFVGNGTRQAVAAGRGDYFPMFMHDLGRLFENRLIFDVSMVMVSPPDENGECSFGISCDYSEPSTRNPRTQVILEINKNMPYIYGTTINISRAAAIVEADHELITLGAPSIGATEQSIGKNIADLINDGDCVQFGIGAIPEAVANLLYEKKDLGVHSELLSDGIMKLYEAGVISNGRKTLHPGKFVTNFLMGTRKLYDWADHNEEILLKPCDYVNDPYVIAQNDNMVSINAAMQVDLFGQVNANTIGPDIYSGMGGQVDFVRGARRSKGGRSFIALPSTAKNGTITKIVARLDPGAAVTTSRYDVQYVVTEYGVANLWGLNLRQRAKALIEIAHPVFREQLEREAWEYKILR